MKLQDMLDAEWTLKQALEALIEENQRLEQAYHDLAREMVYEGNSISWIHSKARNYGNALSEAWHALNAKGVIADGNTTVAEGIAKLPHMREGG